MNVYILIEVLQLSNKPGIVMFDGKCDGEA